MAVETVADDEPKILLRQLSVDSKGEKGSWRMKWRVESLAQDFLRLNTVRFPHGKFKAGEQRFEPVIRLTPRGAAEFETRIACSEPPGGAVENAFAIFDALWRDDRWRIFVRLRIEIDKQQKPIAIPELITTQRIGFSAGLKSEG